MRNPEKVSDLPAISVLRTESLFRDLRKANIDGFLRGSGNPAVGSKAAYSATLPPVDFDKIATQIAKERSTLSAEQSALEKSLREYNHVSNRLKREIEMLEDLKRISSAPPFVFSRPEGTIFHDVLEARLQSRILFFLENDDQNRVDCIGVLWGKIVANVNIFVVEHDWASAFKNADFDEGDFILPYECCCFEFCVSGARICLLLCRPETGVERCLFVKTRHGFVASGIDLYDKTDGIHRAVMAQARAVCISLDANVVVTELVRANEIFNSARLRRNSPPVHDYHALVLRRRERAKPLPNSSDEPINRKRLHWRRGHWRHFSAHKTWIKWMLVGNPDLGFLDKYYRL